MCVASALAADRLGDWKKARYNSISLLHRKAGRATRLCATFPRDHGHVDVTHDELKIIRRVDPNPAR